MRLSELISLLEDFKSHDEAHDPEVRIAFQPNYPLAADLSAVTLIEREGGGSNRDKPVVWLAADSSVGYSENPYAPSAAWDGDVVAAEDEEEDDEEVEAADSARRSRFK